MAKDPNPSPTVAAAAATVAATVAQSGTFGLDNFELLLVSGTICVDALSFAMNFRNHQS